MREWIRWISTEEMLPPAGKEVLVCAEFDGPGDWRLKVGAIDYNDCWVVYGASWTPTYWTLLPEPPQ